QVAMTNSVRRPSGGQRVAPRNLASHWDISPPGDCGTPPALSGVRSRVLRNFSRGGATMVRLGHRRFGNQRGFTLVELLIVVAIIRVLAPIAVPLYANLQARARIAKAQADTRAIASALSIYMAHCGGLP